MLVVSDRYTAKTDNKLILPTAGLKYLSELNKIKYDGKHKHLLKPYYFDNTYVADNIGNVYRVITGKLKDSTIIVQLMKYMISDGYAEYVLRTPYSESGTNIGTYVQKHIQGHRVVAGLFIPKVPKKDFVNHLDGNRLNNHHSNLEWETFEENIRHSYTVLGKTPWNKPTIK